MGGFATVLKNASWLSVFEIMRMVMPFIALPYLFGTIGGENYGKVIFVQSIIALFALLINFGLDTSAVRDVANFRHEKKQLDAIVSAIFLIKSFFAIISFALLTVFLSVVPKMGNLSIVYYFAFIACLSDIFLPVWYFQGKEEMRKLTIVRFFSISIYTISIFIFIRNIDDYPYMALLHSLSLVLSALIACYYVFIKDKTRFHIPEMAFIKKMFIEAIPFFMSRISLTVNTYMAKIMSGLFLSDTVVAAFDVAQKIINGGMMPMQMFNQALYPNMSKSQDKKMLQRGFRITAVITLCVSVCIFLIADFAVHALSKGYMPEAAGILRILCLYLLFSGFSLYMGTSSLVAFGYQKPFNVSVVWSTVVLIVCYAWMITTGNNSIYLYAMALVAAELMVCSYRFYFCRRYRLF
jgi:PST family polysaccharide transporter